jgi:hypothetical protein
MARRAFFSFHYDRDIWRVSQVRNSWVTQDRETAGFWDAAAWERVKRGGDAAIKRWIEDQLSGTSVTVVLIGAETSTRPYVIHEIQRSCVLGKGLVGIRIHALEGKEGYPDRPGANPFDQLGYDRPGGGRQQLSQIYRTYDYVADNGYANLARWIEEAAKATGR